MRIKFCRINIEISFYFAAVVSLMLVLTRNQNTLWLFALCLLHEAGHLGSMLLFGKTPKLIELGYYGMKIVPGQKSVSVTEDIIILLSGPAVNILLYILFILLNKNDIAFLSLTLAIFNLLPVEILDGGRVLSYIFNGRVLKKISLITNIIIIAIGVAIAVYTKTNFSVLIVGLYIMVGSKPTPLP